MPQPPKVTPRAQVRDGVRLDSIKNPQPRPPPGPQGPPPKRKKIERIHVCTVPSCQSRDLEEENGYLICQTCGTVLQETNIVSDNMFIDAPGGESMRTGVTVGNDAARARVYDALAARIVGGMSSREVSEANGRQAIRAVAGHPLNIVQDLQDTAMQVYKLCLANNFVQGRLTKSVAAVCLYIACRRSKENNKFMLIDFADKCYINVFKLGSIFKDLLDVLHLSSSAFQSLEPINIESLILRFAEQMNFGRMKQRIANEAVRIVQRMSRDWMTDGRRPAGICGAALILAARMNNFRRVVREVVYTVKVAEVTILKRLDEFSQTESSGLTVEEFRTKDLERAEDPPSFRNKDKAKKKKKNKKGKRKRAREIEENDEEDDAVEATEGASERELSATPSNANDQLQTPAATQAQRDRQSMPPPPVPIDPALLHVSRERVAQPREQSESSNAGLSSKRGRGRPPGKVKPTAPPSRDDLQLEARIEADIEDILRNENNVENARNIHQNPDAPGFSSVTRTPATDPPTPSPMQPPATLANTTRQSPSPQREPQAEQPVQPENTTEPRSPPQTQQSPSNQAVNNRSHSRSSTPQSSNSQPHSRSTSQSPSPPPEQTPIKPIQLITATSTTQPLLDAIPNSEIIPDSEFASDPEITNCLLTASEIAIKERLWVHENSEYLRAQQSKLLRRQLAEQNGTARVVVRRKRRRTRMGDLRGIYDVEAGEEAGPKDAAEAVERMMRKRGFSRKINYGVIGKAYESKGGTPTRGSEGDGSRTGSVVLGASDGSPAGERMEDNGGAEEGMEGGRQGDSREQAIEVQDGGDDSEADDYYDENDEMDLMGVDEVLGRMGDEDADGDEDDEADDY
ncbi:MAG: hypothetical protein Q9219_003018 [cf. Caloplaca sp. 3 TL-2023]